MSLLIGNGRVVTPGEVLEPGWVDVAAPAIAATGSGSPPREPDHDLGGQWLVPGFIDIHVHGGGGASYQDGVVEAAVQVRDFHRRHGTTTTLASLVSAPLDELCSAAAALADLVRDGVLRGIHLEGPFLSAPYCGAHDPSLLREPAPGELARLLDAGAGAVTMVTLAPELDRGLDAVRQVVDRGATAAIGHTGASYETTVAAVEAGARVATHLFNGMPPMHHRDPGPVLALLEDARVTVELIADRLHVHPAMVRQVLAQAGADRVALVSDAIVAAGVGDGHYQLGGLGVRVENGLAVLVDGDSIAGSTLTMDVALRNTVNAGVAVADAVAAVSATPARVLGLEHEVGAIAAGLTADLVVLDDDLVVQQVMASGEWV